MATTTFFCSNVAFVIQRTLSETDCSMRTMCELKGAVSD